MESYLTINNTIDDTIENCLNDFKGIIKNADIKQENFLKYIVNEIYSDTDTNKINVVPVRCGFGKSVAIKVILRNIIKDNINNKKYNGIIVVTDSKKRLEEIKQDEELMNYAYYMRYIDENNTSIYELENSTKKQIIEQNSFPILLMTSQKYERLSNTARRSIYKWQNGERKIVIFDEKPFIYKTTVIDLQYMTDIKKEIEQSKEDSDYLYEEFRKVDNYLEDKKQVMKEIGDIVWYKKNENSLLNNEKEFLSKAKKNLNADIYYKIEQLIKFNAEGGLFVNKKNSKANNRKIFIKLNDNMSKFDNDIKYWIFDATSNKDVEYTDNRFSILNIDDKKDNSNISLKWIMENSSKQSLKNRNYYKVKALNAFINNLLVNMDKLLIVTYKEYINKLLDNEKIVKGYFGNLKGFNHYKDIENIVHIGLNRQPDYYYLSLFLLINKTIIDDLNLQEEYRCLDNIMHVNKETFLFNNEEINNIMLSKMYIDFEQNVYRTRLRDFSFSGKINIYVMCKPQFTEFINIIQKYLNVKVKQIKPIEFEEAEKLYKSQNSKLSVADRIITYFNTHISDFDEKPINNILEELEISPHQFKKAKENNKEFKKFMDLRKSRKRGYYNMWNVDDDSI